MFKRVKKKIRYVVCVERDNRTEYWDGDKWVISKSHAYPFVERATADMVAIGLLAEVDKVNA